ncbi:MAG: membrane protein insertion efficiency factor YidD [Clostridiales bacterium]|jgi:putative membrane protein insertion efficiency factor|nr:membrane protein insertion efficiency factor YidD [Clostridiales bacterium]
MKRFSAKNLVIALIKGYQRHIAPGKRPCCRFYPTCSVYALEAVERFGAIRGCALAIRRVLRCNPLNRRHGIDLVPEV